ncbi:MAG: Spy/CpxP family protein refolding chaperone [Desulfobacterales bacterium]
MVKKGLYLSLIAFLFIGIAGFAGCRRHSPYQKAEFMVDYVSETLDLNESQKEHLDQIKEELLEKGSRMHADKAAMHSELVSQLRSEEIDQERLKAMVTEHRVKMEEMIDLAIVKLAEFHKTLTPEQREKLVAKLESFKKWHGHGWE